jgi:alkylated DNA repair dioxygenase AlkB
MKFLWLNNQGRIYPYLHQVKWDHLPELSQIRDFIGTTFKITPDYCLVHIYPDGQANINWYNDKEALVTPIFSVSFGATENSKTRCQFHNHFIFSDELKNILLGIWKYRQQEIRAYSQ